MAKLTITEALQEVKTIASRVDKKQNSIGNYIARDSRIRDPLEKTGGSTDFIKKERQAIADLRTRLISIRSAIQSTNLSSDFAICGITKKVADWLTWRREVSAGEKQFVDSMLAGIRRVRNEVQQKGGRVTATSMGSSAMSESYSPTDPPNIVVNVDEMELMKEQESIETCLGELDGKLSLFNATTFVEV